MFIVLTGSIVVGQANANDMVQLRSQWDIATFEVSEDARETALNKLAEQARAVCENDPDNVDLLIWKGIIVSSLAGEQGGLGALKLAKEAKASFERALQTDPTALNGSAYGSLGTLYHQVPGWPIGFGSDKKARVHLDKALAIDPSGIVNNFFMAEFMLDEGEYEKSKHYLLKALAAPDRPGRQTADIGRRQAAEQLLVKVEKKLD